MRKTSDPPEGSSGIPGSVWVAAARITMSATLWLVRRPFLIPRAHWVIALLISIGVDAAAWLIAPTPVAIALISLPLVIAAVLAHWWWLGRGSDPIVFISIFEGRSKLGRHGLCRLTFVNSFPRGFRKIGGRYRRLPRSVFCRSG